jgi:hypothetical protein
MTTRNNSSGRAAKRQWLSPTLTSIIADKKVREQTLFHVTYDYTDGFGTTSVAACNSSSFLNGKPLFFTKKK